MRAAIDDILGSLEGGGWAGGRCQARAEQQSQQAIQEAAFHSFFALGACE
jgi:hypothetical protein